MSERSLSALCCPQPGVTKDDLGRVMDREPKERDLAAGVR